MYMSSIQRRVSDVYPCFHHALRSSKVAGGAFLAVGVPEAARTGLRILRQDGDLKRHRAGDLPIDMLEPVEDVGALALVRTVGLDQPLQEIRLP